MNDAGTTKSRFASYLYVIHDDLLKNNRLCYGLVSVMVLGFALAEMNEVSFKEEIYNGYDNTISRVIIPNCSWDAPPYDRGQVNWYLVCVSYLSFENARIIPTLISFGMIPMTFLLARKLSNNVVALITSAGLMLTPTFFIFDTSAAFAQTWSILFLGALYLAKKRPYLCVPVLLLSLYAKSIPIIWLPVVIWIIMSSGRGKREKIISIGVLCGMVGIISFHAILMGIVVPVPPSSAGIGNGLSITWGSFRWSEPILLVLPFAVVFHIMFQKKLAFQRFPVLLAMYSVGSIFVISSFTTGVYFPYRIIPNLIIILFCYAYMIHGMMYHIRMPR